MGIGGLKTVVRLGLIGVQTCAGQGQLAEGTGLDDRMSVASCSRGSQIYIRLVNVICEDASDQLPLWHYCRGLTAFDKLAEDWGVRIRPFNLSSTRTVASRSVSNFVTGRIGTSCSLWGPGPETVSRTNLLTKPGIISLRPRSESDALSMNVSLLREALN